MESYTWPDFSFNRGADCWLVSMANLLREKPAAPPSVENCLAFAVKFRFVKSVSNAAQLKSASLRPDLPGTMSLEPDASLLGLRHTIVGHAIVGHVAVPHRAAVPHGVMVQAGILRHSRTAHVVMRHVVVEHTR